MYSSIKGGLRNAEYQQGQGLVEYSLVIALVAVVVILVFVLVGEEIQTLYHRAYSEVRCAQLANNKVAIFQADPNMTDNGETAGELAFYRREGVCRVVPAVDYSDYRRADRDAGVEAEI